MNINETAFQLALIFLPGVICAGIVDKLTIHKDRSTFEFVIRSFVFGIACYVIYFVLSWLVLGAVHSVMRLDSPLTLAQFQMIRIVDVSGALIIAFLLGTAWSAAVNHKILIRLMQYLQITRKYGDENIWDFTFNLNVPNVEYAYIRDFDKKVVYSGWIKAFSEGVGRREVLMERVEVFDLDTASKLFDAPLIYVSFSQDNFHIEFPYRSREGAAQ